MKLQDTPYTVNVAPREFIQNIQAQTPDDLFKVMPNVRTITPQISGYGPVINLRGFNTSESSEDGFRRFANFATNLEDKERVEILNGVSGFLYGAAPPGGMVNYVYKRPTQDRLNSVTVGNYGGDQYYVHGDFGGRIDAEGRAGYRLNIVKQEGDTAIDDQNLNRELISGAFDWQVTDRLKIETTASHYKYEAENPASYWYFFPGAATHYFVPDPRKNWTQKWIRDEFEKNRFSTKVTYQLSDAVTIRGGYMIDDVDRPVQDHALNYVTSNNGTYLQRLNTAGETKYRDQDANIMADIKVDTGPVAHKLTFGYFLTSYKYWGTPYSQITGYLGPYTIEQPTYGPEPAFPANTSSPYLQSRAKNDNYFIGDYVTFDDQWSLLAGANYSRIAYTSFGSTGAVTADYDDGRTSPSVSLMYKPIPWMTLYGTYIEGLERGGVAPSNGTVDNPGAVMPPMVSTQLEVGVKADIAGMLFTAALFDIDKAYELTTNRIYSQDGRQRHQGLELTATGKPINRLTVLGGLTLLDPMVEGGTYDGKMPINVAEFFAKLYAEYELPGMNGLFLTGGVYYTGDQWADANNTDQLPSYTTMDLGLRYETEVAGHDLTMRVNVANVTDERYWMDAYYLGAPRTFLFSAQTKF